MRARGADGSQLLALAEVRIYLQLLRALLLYQVHVHRQVLEIPRQSACTEPTTQLFTASSVGEQNCEQAQCSDLASVEGLSPSNIILQCIPRYTSCAHKYLLRLPNAKLTLRQDV